MCFFLFLLPVRDQVISIPVPMAPLPWNPKRHLSSWTLQITIESFSFLCWPTFLSVLVSQCCLWGWSGFWTEKGKERIGFWITLTKLNHKTSWWIVMCPESYLTCTSDDSLSPMICDNSSCMLVCTYFFLLFCLLDTINNVMWLHTYSLVFHLF